MAKYFHLTLAGFVLMGLICVPPQIEQRIAGKPLPGPLAERFKDWEEVTAHRAALFGVMAVVHHGLKNYVMTHLRLPKGLTELCEGPYLIVDCKDLLNPYTGRPVFETPKGELGSIWVELDPPGGEADLLTKFSEMMTQFHWDTGKPRVEQFIFGFVRDYINPNKSSPYGEIYASDTPAELIIGSSIESEMTSLGNLFADQCQLGRGKKGSYSFQEMTSIFPILNKLKNPYTGGYARLIAEKVIDAMPGTPEADAQWLAPPRIDLLPPSPGDFTIVWLPSQSILRLLISVHDREGRRSNESLWAHKEKYLRRITLPVPPYSF